MKKLSLCLMLAFIFGMTSFSHAAQDKDSLSLSLEESIIKALENNLNVAIQVLNPDLSELSVSQAKEKFFPSLSFNFFTTDQQQASYSWLDSADVLQTEQNRLAIEFSQLIPTGGTLNISLNGSLYNTNRSFQTINPSYRSTLTFDFNQPLLRNFGFNVTRREIIVAQNNLGISENDLRKSLQDTVYEVEQAYWNLVFSRENLKVIEQSLNQARNLLENNKREIEIGTRAPIDIINAQASVASWEAQIVSARALVKNREDELKTILNLEKDRKDFDLIALIPTDAPRYMKKEMSLDQAIATALANRPDLKSTRYDIQNKKTNLNYAKNQLLPQLDLTASYWSPGVSGDRLVYLNNNIYSGIIVDTVPSGMSDSLKDVFGFRYKNWSIGLTLTVPFDTLLSRASYAQARIDLELSELRLKQQHQQIFLEIKTALRDVESNYQSVQAFKVARELAEKQLEAEEEKFKVGLSTNFQILQYQTDLASARSNELQAMIDYNLSLARLNRALGISLNEKNISISKLANN